MSQAGQQTDLVHWNAEAADLSEAERLVYEEVMNGEKSYGELAEEQGWSSRGTVSNLVRRVREKVGDAPN